MLQLCVQGRKKGNEDSLTKGENLENVVDTIVVINTETIESKEKEEDDHVASVKPNDVTSEGEQHLKVTDLPLTFDLLFR